MNIIHNLFDKFVKMKYRLVQIVCLLVILVCVGYLIHYDAMITAQENTYSNLRVVDTEKSTEELINTETEIVELETETVDVFPVCDQLYDFDALQVENEDIYAWITVPGTEIDYPVLQSDIDNYYLDYNVDHSKGYPGCIYSNNCNTKDFSDYISVIYGHNMKNKSMFGSLHNFEDSSFFTQYKSIVVYTQERRFTYEIFAAVRFSNIYIPADYDVKSLESKELFLSDIFACKEDEMSNVIADYVVQADDKLLVLSTCINGQKQNRYLVVGKLIEEAQYN